MNGEKKKQNMLRSQFVIRNSLLDDLDSGSKLREDPFIGVYHLIITFQYLFFVITLILRILEGQLWEDLQTVITLLHEFYIIILLFLTMGFFPLVTYVLHYLLFAFNLNELAVSILYRVLQFSFLGILAYIRLTKDWPLSHFLFAGIQGMIVFMKTQSYHDSLLQYRHKKLTNCSYKEAIEIHRFIYFICAPVLVFEPEYPKIPRIRFKFVIMKSLQSIFYLITSYELFEIYLRPVIQDFENLPLWTSLIKMLCPMGLILLNVFFCIFESILNAYAELSRFGDRLFYLDFWNSTNFDEFSRKWNRPVHEFLKRHVYSYFIDELGCLPLRAYVGTLLYSAFFHEFTIFMCFGRVNTFLSNSMLVQTPLIFLGNMMRNNNFGNIFYWSTMVVGVTISFFPYIVDFSDHSSIYF